MLARIGVLYCIDALFIGGTEIQLQGLSNHLDLDRFEPWICTFRPFDSGLVPVSCSTMHFDVPSLVGPAAFRAVRELASFLKRKRIDVVQTFFQDATVLGTLAARLAGVPVRIGSFRDMGFWRDRKQALLGRLVYPSFTDAVANSAAVRDHAETFAGMPPGIFRVIPNGIDVERFSRSLDKPDRLSVAIVGNFNRPVKRTDLFVEAVAELAPRFPDVDWLIAGEGKLEPELRRLAAERGVTEAVDFVGRIDDVPGFLAGAHIGVNCSDSEGFSNAVTEYMLSGCAVVATAVGGNAEAVIDGETGLLVRPDDKTDLATALARLIEDRQLRRRLAGAALEQAAREFSWTTCAAKHGALYEDALNRAKAR